MRYEDALKVWGASRIEQNSAWIGHKCRKLKVVVASVTVTFDFDEGYACCGGMDPNCYCSFAESPSADVVMTASCASCGTPARYTMSAEDFNFVEVLAEIVDAGNGVITAE